MIEDTVPFNRQMIAEVYELINIFPYCQSAHLLLLKGLYNNGDVKFENQLKNSAIHVGDREVLYWLLKASTLSKTEINKEPEESKLKQEVVSDTQTGVIKNIQESEFRQEAVSDTQQTVIETAKNSELMIHEIEKDSNESEMNENQDSSVQDSSHSVMIATEPDILEPAGVIFLQEEEYESKEERVFFMDPGFSFAEHSDLLELDLDLDEDRKPLSLEDELEIGNWSDKDSKKLLQAKLIDKFIIANPRIEAQKDKPLLPEEGKSVPSVEEEVGLVTETLAKIYVCQGYYSKAIDIYEKLSLKFPEKSSYFASQIEKVKEYIKK
jgi:tetratricopeptide (TPR) repeat protein